MGVGAGEIVYSICDQTASAANVNNNQKFLQKMAGPGGKQRVFSKRAPGRRRQINNKTVDSKITIKLTSPVGEEVLNAGEKYLISWESDAGIEKVKLEYSPDNGTKYLPIAVDVDNIGHYEWLVPHHISSHCLVRVSEDKGRKMLPHGLFYEFYFRADGDNFSGSGDGFTIYLGDAGNEAIRQNLPLVSFSFESNGKAYIELNGAVKEIATVKGFNGSWHNLQIFMDNVHDQISVTLNGAPVFENIPRLPMAYFSPALSFSVGPGKGKVLEIDDVVVKAFYLIEDRQQWFALFNEDFECFNEENEIENSGWRTKGKPTFENNQMTVGIKHLSILSVEDEQVTVVKSFNIPVDFPFDVSDRSFEIRYNDSMNGDSATYDAFPGHGGIDVSSNSFYSSSSRTLSNSIPGRSRTTELINTYYIYTYDGKLLAEYDHNGTCVRDYIYAGNRLIAEYKPQTGEYFYYMTDQINSTRIITDGSGNVVFSEAYGPYGDVQKTWANTYDPKLKFSGKEREGYSDLDYFGARYYDHKSYRFNSVDPIINREEALYNPQLWNLYAYCKNNPITLFDPDGRDVILLNTKKQLYGDGHTAVLIGNNDNGWKYFSKDGEKFGIGGTDQNTFVKFKDLKDFKESKLWEKYKYRFHIKTTAKDDLKMLVKAKFLLNNEYSIENFNCTDYTEEILKAGNIRVKNLKQSDFGYHHTSPNKQYRYVKKHNKRRGKELK